MDVGEKENLIAALQRGGVTVVFKKIDTEEVRIMPCTLAPSILEANGVNTAVQSQRPESDHIVCWALDKNAWRSFRAETVVSWESNE